MNEAATAMLLITATDYAIQQGRPTALNVADDRDITSAVKQLLRGSQMAAEAAISVQTLNGCVMLWGWVQSTAQRCGVESLAWRAKGVRSVQNELSVQL